jgi:hypothetical protein
MPTSRVTYSDHDGNKLGYIDIDEFSFMVYPKDPKVGKAPKEPLSWSEVFRKLLAAMMIAGTLTMVGCAENPEVQASTQARNLPANYGPIALAAVKASLKDPASCTVLRLSDEPITNGNGRTGVFVDVNAKNSFGGYTGIQPVLVMFKDGQVSGMY